MKTFIQDQMKTAHMVQACIYAAVHWATLQHHSDVLWAAISATFQVNPILNKSLLTVLLQFARGRPGPLLNPGTSQCNACRGMHWWSIRITCPSQHSLFSLSLSSILHCPVLTSDLFICHTSHMMLIDVRVRCRCWSISDNLSTEILLYIDTFITMTVVANYLSSGSAL